MYKISIDTMLLRLSVVSGIQIFQLTLDFIYFVLRGDQNHPIWPTLGGMLLDMKYLLMNDMNEKAALTDSGLRVQDNRMKIISGRYPPKKVFN